MEIVFAPWCHFFLLTLKVAFNSPADNNFVVRSSFWKQRQRLIHVNLTDNLHEGLACIWSLKEATKVNHILDWALSV